MNRIWKRISVFAFLIILAVSCIRTDIKASVPLSLAVNLTGNSMKQGDTMHISVALQNYDENYTDNVITTIIIEVSVNTENISINKDSISADIDEGAGMGFLAAQMKDESNVELQYLNVGDPLKKGTRDLYSFDITALKDIDYLPSFVQITYAIMQDGTREVSERLSVVPVIMINGKVAESEKIDEKFTSEYGTITPPPISLETSAGSGETGNNETSETDSQTGTLGNNESPLESSTKTDNTSETNSTSISDNNSETRDMQLSQDNKESERNKEDKTTREDETDSQQETSKDIKEKTEEKKSGKIFMIIAVIFILTLILAGSFIYYKKVRNSSQNSHN